MNRHEDTRPNRRPRALDGERGFTLIELLVVILIIGILAAIAIPSFLNQKSKAQDGAAKVQARTAETAAETYSTDHNGEYKGMEAKALQEIEPTLNDKTVAELQTVKAPEAGGYVVASKSISTGDEFVVERTATGEIKRTCKYSKAANKGGCPLEKW
jgi:type IV pilus assembly protein PilA